MHLLKTIVTMERLRPKSTSPESAAVVELWMTAMLLRGPNLGFHVGHVCFVYISVHPVVLPHSLAFPWQ